MQKRLSQFDAHDRIAYYSGHWHDKDPKGSPALTENVEAPVDRPGAGAGTRAGDARRPGRDNPPPPPPSTTEYDVPAPSGPGSVDSHSPPPASGVYTPPSESTG